MIPAQRRTGTETGVMLVGLMMGIALLAGLVRCEEAGEDFGDGLGEHRCSIRSRCSEVCSPHDINKSGS